MIDRTVTLASGSEDEERFQNTLRPRGLAEFIGQETEKRRLSIAIQAAKMRGDPLSTSGPALEKTLDLMGMLTKLDEGDVFFIDEIHRLPRVVEEYLYPAMEDFKIDYVVDKGPYAEAIPLPLKRFTLVGATTRKGLLSSPLHDRFGLNFKLDFYGLDDLTKIVSRSARLLHLEIEPDAAREIATRSRGTPRIANRLLRRVRDFAQVHGFSRISREVVQQSLELEGVDELGLDDLDRRYLRTLIQQHEVREAVGLGALAATMQQEQDTLEDVVEPYLLHEGFILRTSTGRRASPKAYAHLGLQAPARSAQPRLPLDAS